MQLLNNICRILRIALEQVSKMPSIAFFKSAFLKPLLVVLAVYWAAGQLAAAQEVPATYPKHVDLGVSGVTFNFRKSAEELLGADVVLNPLDDDRTSIRCANADKSQVATFIHHTGLSKHSIQEFQVELVDDPKGELPSCVLSSVIKFKTFRGIELGISISQLTQLLGDNFRVDVKGSRTMLSYTLDSNLLSAFLQYYGALSYFATYSFKHGKLVKLEFGLR